MRYRLSLRRSVTPNRVVVRLCRGRLRRTWWQPLQVKTPLSPHLRAPIRPIALPLLVVCMRRPGLIPLQSLRTLLARHSSTNEAREVQTVHATTVVAAATMTLSKLVEPVELEVWTRDVLLTGIALAVPRLVGMRTTALPRSNKTTGAGSGNYCRLSETTADCGRRLHVILLATAIAAVGMLATTSGAPRANPVVAGTPSPTIPGLPIRTEKDHASARRMVDQAEMLRTATTAGA